MSKMLEIQQGKDEDEEEHSTTQHKVDTKSLDHRVLFLTQTSF